MSTRVMLVDDHEIFRLGLRALIEVEDDVEVVAEAGDGDEALAILAEVPVDIVVLDLTLQEVGGLEVARQTAERFPDVKTVVLSMHSDEKMVLEALRCGAVGYVLKDACASSIIDAIHSVGDGHRYLSHALSERAIDAYIESGCVQDDDALTHLTARETEVIRLVADGQTSAQVAETLTISPRTVESHRSNSMHKLGLKNHMDLVRYAVKTGIVTLDE